MTVGIAARFDKGIVCVSDSSITTGNNRITLPHIKGQYVYDGFALYAGDLASAQQILRRAASDPLHEVVLDMSDELGDDDGADFLLIGEGMSMSIIDQWGAKYSQEHYAAIGHGADGARMLLRGMYQSGNESYVAQTLKTIVTIIQEFDNTVYGPVRTATFYDPPS